LLFSSVVASTLALAGVANAQQPASHCPPGSWFCADTEQHSAAPAGQPLTLQPLPGPHEVVVMPPPPPPPHTTYIYGAGGPPPPVVVYQPPPPVVVYQ